MKIKLLNTFTFYCAVLLTICTWWYVALSPVSTNSNMIPSLPSASLSLTSSLPKVFPYLSSMDRVSLHQALAGDVKLIGKLIGEWDVDAQILETEGVVAAKRLPRKLYIRGHLLGRRLISADDSESDKKFLPQTYQAASYLMALTSPNQIVGIPKGLRSLTQLYPEDLTSKIPLNIDPYQAEALYEQNPSLAIVSSVYTDPSAIQTLRNQGIPLIAQRQTEKLEDIQASILEIGQAIGQKQKAELLSIFIEAALMAIDNRLLAMSHMVSDTDSSLTTLYLNHHTQYSTPTPLSLTGQLLSRVDRYFPLAKNNTSLSLFSQYSIPIAEEDLLELNPENLIITTDNPQEMWEKIAVTPSLSEVSAVQQSRVYFVSETVQAASDQYLVLAYYDIACGVISAHTL